jgi:hypothetical protein
VADDTAAVQAAIDTGSCILSYQRVYSVTALAVNKRATHIQGSYGILQARAVVTDALLTFEAPAQFSYISGPLKIDMDYQLGYGSAVHINARNTRILHLEIWSAKLAYMIGKPSWDTVQPSSMAEQGVSEIQIIG